MLPKLTEENLAAAGFEYDEDQGVWVISLNDECRVGLNRHRDDAGRYTDRWYVRVSTPRGFICAEQVQHLGMVRGRRLNEEEAERLLASGTLKFIGPEH